MHGLESIKAINNVPGLDRVRKNIPLASYVLEEYSDAVDDVYQRYARNELTKMQLREELQELKATYW